MIKSLLKIKEKTKNKLKLLAKKKVVLYFLSFFQKLFPGNEKIRLLIARIYLLNKNWEMAIQSLEEIINAEKQTQINDIVYWGLGKAYRKRKEFNKSLKILESGIKKFPQNIRIMLELADTFISLKNWENAILWYEKSIDKNSYTTPFRIYKNLAISYMNTNQIEKSEEFIEKALKTKPNHKKLMVQYSEIMIKKKAWDKALEILLKCYSLYKEEPPFEVLQKIIMVNKILGHTKNVEYYYQRTVNIYSEKLENDKIGYRQMILFDNGQSRIEFYHNFKSTNTVIVTFDSLNMIWDELPFGFKLLSRQNVDIIAVRKREKGEYHQDLSREDFYNTLNKLVKEYPNKVAYGFSLGGYTSLYYASSLDCRILSLSPRLSIHPIYGSEKEKQEHIFKHELSHPVNKYISPIIVFDPKDKMDNTYIYKDLVKSYPNAKLVKIPYGSHGMAPHLLKMGLLKEFILTVLFTDEVPKYDRSKKVFSSYYYRELGEDCLNHNKLNWAMNLVNRALEILPTDVLAMRLKINIYKKMNEFDSALKFAEKGVKTAPKKIHARTLLIDLSMQMKKYDLAKEALDKALRDFNNSSILLVRKENLDRIIESNSKS